MISPRRPDNEDERLASLHALNVLDTPAEERFDRITRIAKALFDVPFVLVSLVDEKRQWFKSKQGLTVCETPRDISFCGHAILKEDPLVVQDALADERFSDNPLVLDSPSIRFYAGYPLEDHAGMKLGTLCLIGTEPRTFTPAEQALLRDLGKIVENELAIQKLGLVQLEQAGWEPHDRKQLLDPTTGTWSEPAIVEIVRRSIQRSGARGECTSLVLARLECPTGMCATWTDAGADILLAEAAQALRGSLRAHDAVGRMGEGFLVVLAGCADPQIAERVEQVERQIAENPILLSLGVHMSFGFSTSDPRPHGASAAELINRTYDHLEGTPDKRFADRSA